MDTSKTIQQLTEALVNELATNIEAEATAKFEQDVKDRLAKVDFNAVMQTAVRNYLDHKLKEFEFPPNSIPVSAIQTEDLHLSGDQVGGGIIKGFSSTGIDDRATNCVVTILDSAVVVENNLVTLDLTVQGNLDVKGTVPKDSEFYKQLTASVTNTVQSGLDTTLFSGFSDVIFDKIKTDGLDLSKITVDGKVVVEGDRIGYSITESNLQKLGLLKELQVQGETQLADTLYVGNKRVGINTIEPSAALAVWDEDIEITASKFKDNTAKIGTPRSQALVLSSNTKNNITLHTDGGTEIPDLRVGSCKIGSSDTPPRYSSIKGHIVFNSNPSPGGPMGWVCLGAANWANFGIID